jgi:hypothetical protein
MVMDLNSVYRRNENVVSRKIVDELILVPIRTNVADMESIYSLNEVGASVYALIDGQRSVGDICAAIAEEFEVSIDQAETDVTEFLQKLISINSIEEETGNQ